MGASLDIADAATMQAKSGIDHRPGRCALVAGPRAASTGRIAPLLLLLGLGVGCAAPPPFRQPPDFDARFEAVRTITLVPPKVAVYTMSAGGTEEEVMSWSDAAYEHVVSAVRAEVEELGRTFIPYTGDPLPHRRIRYGRPAGEAEGPRERSAAEESWLLFEAANLAIMRHAYDPWNTFPDRVSNFDYTLGREGAALLGNTDADAYMLIIATDHIPTRDRAALVAAGVAMGAVTGSYAGPEATPARLTLALVEARSGDLLWFNTLSLPLSDLRDEKTDQVLVDMVMKGLEQ